MPEFERKKRRKLAFDENGIYPNHFAVHGSISTMLKLGSENKRSPVHFIASMRPTAVFRPWSVCVSVSVCVRRVTQSDLLF